MAASPIRWAGDRPSEEAGESQGDHPGARIDGPPECHAEPEPARLRARSRSDSHIHSSQSDGTLSRAGSTIPVGSGISTK